MPDDERLSEINEKEMIQKNDSNKVLKTENKTLKFVEDKLNNFINSGNDSPKKVPQKSKKIRVNGEEYDFICSIDEVRTNWRGIEKEDRRKCYVKVLNDRLILDKTGMMIQSDLGSRTIYFSDISSVDFDKSGVFHVTNSIKLIMRGGEFITLLHVQAIEYDLLNDKFNDYKENQHTISNSNFSENSQTNADELLKYAELYEKGIITEDEFNTLKRRIIGNPLNSTVKYCKNCGAEVSHDSKFCTQCGTQIN